MQNQKRERSDCAMTPQEELKRVSLEETSKQKRSTSLPCRKVSQDTLGGCIGSFRKLLPSSESQKLQVLNSREALILPHAKRQKKNETDCGYLGVQTSSHSIDEDVSFAEETNETPKDCNGRRVSMIRRGLPDRNPPGGDFNVYVSLIQRSGAEETRRLVSAIEKKISSFQKIKSTGETLSSDSNYPQYECGTVAYFTGDDFYQVTVANLGGVSLLVKAMNVFETSSEIQAACYRALGNLCLENEVNQESLYRSGGIDITCKSLQLHRNCTSVQSLGCLLLASLTELIISLVTRDDAQDKLLVSNVAVALQRALTMTITQEAQECASVLLRTIESKR